MKGVTRKDVRQLVPMMKPYTDAPKPASSDILRVVTFSVMSSTKIILLEPRLLI